MKSEKIALIFPKIYWNYIDHPRIFNYTKTSLVLQNKLQSPLFQLNTVKSIKWILKIIYKNFMFPLLSSFSNEILIFKSITDGLKRKKEELFYSKFYNNLK